MGRGSAFRLWLGCFVVIALLNAAQLFLAYGHQGLPFWVALRWSFVDWGLWALLWPLIAWLVQMQPLSQARLARSLAVHGPASILRWRASSTCSVRIWKSSASAFKIG